MRMTDPHPRKQRGEQAHQAGLAAEAQVARHYTDRGLRIDAQRWRGRSGEIDLIARQGDEIVFIEVKRSRSHLRAAERVSPGQIARLFDAAGEYLAACGLSLDTPVRFDVALVDAMGRIEIVENALGA